MSRFLIFGAYANGNIGDEYQALSVARHIEAVVPGAEVFATSASTKAVAFDFPSERRVGEVDAITKAEFVNSFSALVIGGGGLFASVHRPLNSPTWPDRIGIPVIVLGIGANPEIASKCSAILKKASYVSARDEFSLGAVQAVRPDAELVNDPILTDPAVTAPLLADRDGLCIIPRKMTDKNKDVYAHLNGQMTASDVVLSMFPSTDRASGALDAFADRPTVLSTTMDSMLDTLRRSRAVVSERFHGCILSLKLGLPCLGLSSSDDESSKIVSLYRQLGISHHLINMRRDPLTRDQILQRLSDFDADAVAAKIDAMRNDLRAKLRRSLMEV